MVSGFPHARIQPHYKKCSRSAPEIGHCYISYYRSICWCTWHYYIATVETLLFQLANHSIEESVTALTTIYNEAIVSIGGLLPYTNLDYSFSVVPFQLLMVHCTDSAYLITFQHFQMDININYTDGTRITK